jgi:hypothetical protein
MAFKTCDSMRLYYPSELLHFLPICSGHRDRTTETLPAQDLAGLDNNRTSQGFYQGDVCNIVGGIKGFGTQIPYVVCINISFNPQKATHIIL